MEVIQPEKKLYPLVMNWVNSEFMVSGAMPGLTPRSQLFAANVSNVPHEGGGLWSRPDLAALVFTRAKFVPSWNTALCSFEVKTADGVSQASVYEAFAHTRFANYSFLIWQGDPASSSVDRLVALCKEFGVGAIVTPAPAIPHSYKVLCAASPTDVDAATVDLFTSQRFSEGDQRRILKWLGSNGWETQAEREQTI